MQEIFSVSKLTTEIKRHLESRFPLIAVKGEISNLKEQSSGHLYFTLKDESAQLSAVFFRGNAKELSRLPKHGDQVIVRGEINVYPPRGYYQLIVRQLEYAGVGELLLKLHALKENLQQRGWFDPAKKKPLPKHPKTIGIVTSPTGAVIQDIIQILQRRCPTIHLLLNPVKVQGEGAAEEIAKAIDDFNQFELADVVIVCRGGGSLEDLWAFNEEIVASAIFRSKIPIISAVGHETDTSISDFVADVRAPTPSAAAEIVSMEMAQDIKFLQNVRSRLDQIIQSSTTHHRKAILSLKRHPFLSTPYAIMGMPIQQLDGVITDLRLATRRYFQEKSIRLHSLGKQLSALNPTAQLLHSRQKTDQIRRAIDTSITSQIATKRRSFDPYAFRANIQHRLHSFLNTYKENISKLANHLQGINPKNLLSKGYCILFQEKNNSVILSTRELKEEDRVSLMLSDGFLHLNVEEITYDKSPPLL